MRRRKRRRWLGRILFGLLALAVVVLVGGWLALRHIPSWYEPVQVPDDQLQRVRDSLTDKFREISDQMVRRSTFEVYVTDHAVTEWVVARAQIWPDSEQWLPEWLSDPVVAFVPGRIVLAAHLEHDGWEAILGAHFSVEVAGDDLILCLDSVTTGALPVPLSSLAGPLERLVHSGRLDPEVMPDELARAVRKLRSGDALSFLAHGQRASGPFIWKNGDRPYRLRGLEIGDGWLKALIEPL
jgi:hypothetical protein